MARECVTAENSYTINQKLLIFLAAPTPFSIRRSYSQVFMPYCFKRILWYQRSSIKFQFHLQMIPAQVYTSATDYLYCVVKGVDKELIQ